MLMDEEIWKDIENYEGYYQVSSLGRVRSVDREIIKNNGLIEHRKGRIKPQTKDRCGYFRVALYKNGLGKNFPVHRLVAQAFIPNPDSLPQINHKNEFDKTDNRVESLEWCDAKYNSNYGTRNKRITEKQSKKVYQYTLDGKLVKVWNSVCECGRNGYNTARISMCCNGKGDKHKGFKWSYTPLKPSENL